MIVTIIGGIVMLVLLAADLLTKAWAESWLQMHGDIPIIPKFLKLRYTENTGIAWGIFNNNPWFMVVITVFTAVMIIAIAVLYFTVFKKNKAGKICLAVIEAGAVGNFLDRIFLGYVRDFVDVSSIGFGVCNIADFFITFGAVALLIVILFVGKNAVIPLGKYRKQAREEDAKKKAEQRGHED